MRALEQQHGPLELFLPKMVRDLGVAGTARELGVSRSVVNYWIKYKLSATTITTTTLKQIPESPVPASPPTKIVRLRPENILEMKPIIRKADDQSTS